LSFKSTADTVTLNDVPAVCGVAAETRNLAVGPGVAVKELLVPVRPLFTESVAVTVQMPVVFGDTLKNGGAAGYRDGGAARIDQVRIFIAGQVHHAAAKSIQIAILVRYPNLAYA
jgi:hypothetical protein